MANRVIVSDVIPSGGNRVRAEQGRTARRAALKPLLWRLHFLSGFLIAPIVVSLAITGILFAWNPQIETFLYRDALTAVTTGPAQPLADQVRSAQEAHPGWKVTAVVPAAPDGEATTGVTLEPPGAASASGFGPAEGATTVYVDPSSARVTGEIVEANRPGEWLRNLHSSWRLGPTAEPVSELAASWLLVSLLTGLYLWWPATRRALMKALRPQLRRPGRGRLRTLHTTLGVVVFAALLIMVGTGLTWTRFAGAWIDLAKDQLHGATPAVSTALAAGVETKVDHSEHGSVNGSASTSVPASTAGVDLASRFDGVAVAAARSGVGGVVKITPAPTPDKAWKVATQDNRWPLERTTVAINPETGQVIDRVEWSDYPLMAKATAVGIAFHQAELFGLGNQIFLTFLAVTLIVMIVAGYRMWWLRRPAGSFGLPPQAGSLLRTAPVPLLLIIAVLMVLLPTLGVSLLAFLVIERLTRSLRQRRVAA